MQECQLQRPTVHKVTKQTITSPLHLGNCCCSLSIFVCFAVAQWKYVRGVGGWKTKMYARMYVYLYVRKWMKWTLWDRVYCAFSRYNKFFNNGKKHKGEMSLTKALRVYKIWGELVKINFTPNKVLMCNRISYLWQYKLEDHSARYIKYTYRAEWSRNLVYHIWDVSIWIYQIELDVE